MASWKRTSRLLLCVCLAALPCSAWAQPVEAQARRIAVEGKKAFDTADYVTAIARYEEAYKLKPAPNLLFNLGQCHRKSGRLDEALSYFRRFLETNPPAVQAQATQTVIAEVEAQLAETKRAEAVRREEAARQARQAEEKAKAEEQARLDEMRVAAARAEAEAAAKKLQLELTRRQETPPPPPITTRWWFWTGVVAVVAAGATTAAVVATAPRPTTTTFPDINAR